MQRIVLPALLAASFASLAEAQILMQDGDVVAGVGGVTSILDAVVNDSGSWILEVDTDNANTNVDGALIKDGALFLQEDGALAAPAGATVNSFGPLSINNAGDSTWNLFLSNTTGSNDDSGIYFGTTLVLQEGTFSSAAGFSPMTLYRGFFGAAINGAGDALVMASVDDPAIPSTLDRALVVLDLDGAGNLLGETVIAKEGDAPAALLGDTITDFETGEETYGWNASGIVTYVARCTSTFGGSAALFLGTTMVARSGDPSPIPGRNWELLTARQAVVNASGAMLFRADLDGSTADDEVIIHRDAGGTLSVVARQGDSLVLPDGLFLIETLGRVALSDAGDILYFANWDDPDTTRDAGLIYNGQVIVQEGKTSISGNPVESLAGLYSLSPDGQSLVFVCKLAGGVDAAVLVDPTDLQTSFCDGSDDALAACPCANPGNPGSGCDNAQATGGVAISLVAQTTAPNGATLQGAGFSTMGAPTAIVIRSNALDPSSPVVFGDGLRCVSATALVRLAATTASGGTSVHTIGHGAMAGTGNFYYQIWYRNTPSTFCDPFAAFNLSNGVRLAW